jgi:hypothetical protein
VKTNVEELRARSGAGAPHGDCGFAIEASAEVQLAYIHLHLLHCHIVDEPERSRMVRADPQAL